VTTVFTTLMRDGIPLHVDDAGGEGRPVVFQHGLCADARQTIEVFPSDAASRRVTLECRGHGRTGYGNPQAIGIATFVEDVAALIGQLGASPVVVGGISMGAAIALRLAVERPGLARALILARPAWVAQRAPDNMSPNAEVGRLLATNPPELARTKFLAGPTAARLARDAPDNLASLCGFFGRAPVAETAVLLERISDDGPGVTERQIGTLRVPALVIGTDGDAIHPMRHAEALAALIPGSRLVRITSKGEDRGRYVAEFRAAISHFLGSIE
jgi:pimeloyl-ACP methyl ester carboxylesterase